MSLAPPEIDPAFEEKRQAWKDILSGKDQHAILHQVYDLVWDAAVYHVILEARRVAPKDKHGVIMMPGLIHQMIDRCFYVRQTVGVRRLMEQGAMTGPRSVYSLRSLLEDLKKHREALTRRNFFAAFNRCMDVGAVKAAEIAFCREQGVSGRRSYHIPREFDAGACAELHEQVDTLCGTAANARRDSDVVAPAVFEAIDRQLAEIEKLLEHVNKFVAHAATPESRASVDADVAKLTFADLWKSLEIICRVCQFVDVYLLSQTSHNFLAIYSGDLFQFAERPFTDVEGTVALRAEWAGFEKKVESWSQDPMAWLLKPAASHSRADA